MRLEAAYAARTRLQGQGAGKFALLQGRVCWVHAGPTACRACAVLKHAGRTPIRPPARLTYAGEGLVQRASRFLRHGRQEGARLGVADLHAHGAHNAMMGVELARILRYLRRWGKAAAPPLSQSVICAAAATGASKVVRMTHSRRCP